jgi:hypothetical protein
VSDLFGPKLDSVSKSISEFSGKTKAYQKKVKSQFDHLLDVNTSTGSKSLQYLKKKLIQTVKTSEPKIAKILFEEILTAIGCDQQQTYVADVPILISVKSVDLGGILTIDPSGNAQFLTGAVVVYAPAPATTISAATTLTNAQLQPGIVVTSGTSFTLTMALGTTLETLVTWAATNLGFDFSIINTASGTITLDATEVGVTSVGTMTVLTGISAQFRIRRTAANTFIVYRIG